MHRKLQEPDKKEKNGYILPSHQLLQFLTSIYLDPEIEPLIFQRIRASSEISLEKKLYTTLVYQTKFSSIVTESKEFQS